MDGGFADRRSRSGRGVTGIPPARHSPGAGSEEHQLPHWPVSQQGQAESGYAVTCGEAA